MISEGEGQTEAGFVIKRKKDAGRCFAERMGKTASNCSKGLRGASRVKVIGARFSKSSRSVSLRVNNEYVQPTQGRRQTTDERGIVIRVEPAPRGTPPIVVPQDPAHAFDV